MSRESDRADIQDTVLRYAAGVDAFDMDLFQTAFTHDVEVIGLGPEAIEGLSSLVESVKVGRAVFSDTQHLLSPSLIQIDGDTAHARTEAQAIHFYKEPEGRSITMWATYEMELVRTGDGWKIRRNNVVTKALRTADEPG